LKLARDFQGPERFRMLPASIRNLRYVVEPVAVANARSQLEPGTDTITVDSVEGFEAGCAFEIRKEYRHGRANYPLIQQVVASAIEGNAIRFSPPVADDRFIKPDARANILVRRFDPIVVDQWQAEGDSLGGESHGVAVKITSTQLDGRYDISVEREYSTTLTVGEERLSFDLNGEVKHVFRRNRLIDTGAFQSEYWLDDQGFSLGSGSQTNLYFDARLRLRRVDRPDQPFGLVPVSAFRERYPLAMARDRSVTTYAASPIGPARPACFEVKLPSASAISGMRFVWYWGAPGNIELAAKLNGSEVARTGGDVGKGWTHEATFEAPVYCDTIRVTASGAPNLLMRYIDVLWAGQGYAADVVLGNDKLHRYYRVESGAPVKLGTGGAIMTASHWPLRSAGSRLVERFTVKVSGQTDFADMPRPMHVPGGARAAFIWTEHADLTTVQSHRAVCYGRSTISRSADAIGGFVKAGVPVTKTLFYANPNKKKLPDGVGLQATLTGTPKLFDLVQDLHRNGWDIGIHSPQPDNSTRELNEEAVAFFDREFDATTWIDHSCAVVFNGVSALGLIPNQPHYTADLLEKHGLRFVWQFGCEDGAEHFLGGLSILQTRIGDWTMSPLTWTNPIAPGLTFWPTSAGADIAAYSDEQLDELIAEQGVAIVHTYPASHMPPGKDSQYFDIGEDGTITTSAQFEALLKRFVDRRPQLQTITIRTLCEHLEAIAAVLVDPADGGWRVTNRGDKDIPSLPLAVGDRIVTVELPRNSSVLVPAQ
jgi:hypothetical protein